MLTDRRSVGKGVEERDMAATPPPPPRPATINLPARIKSRLRSSESPQSVGGRESPSGLPSPSPTASSPYRLRPRFERNVSLASLAPSPASIGRKVSAVSLTALEKAEKAAKSERYKTWDYELDKFTGLTTFHGLVRLYHSSWKFKVFWLAVIAVATALFMMQMVNLFDIVSAKPTVSQVRFNFSNNGTRFPVVTVCNYNPVTLSYVNQLNASGDMPEEVLKYIMLTYLQVENLAEYSNETLQHWHQQYQKYKKHHEDFDVADFFHRAAQPCSNMFKKCSFGGKPFDCCAHAEPVLTDIGQCYQFNSFSNRTWKNRQYISGVFYGLQLILDVNRSDYTEVYMDNFFEIGVRFFVHSHGQLPYLSTGGLSLSPGNRLYAGITPIHYQLLPREEWGNCKADYAREEVETLGLAAREDGGPAETYTASNCEAHCVSTQFANRCDCVPMRYKTHDTTNKVCEPAELLSCLHSHAIDEDEEYWYKLCPNCLMECDRWDYQLQTSYAEFPNRGAKKYFEKKYNYTEPQVVRNLAVLDLFLKEISFTEYEQIQATTWTETFSDIGGNMGLFLGMSAITIAEVSVFLVKCCWGSASAKRRAKVLKRRNSVPSQLDVVPEEPSQRPSPAHGPSDPALRRPAQLLDFYLGQPLNDPHLHLFHFLQLLNVFNVSFQEYRFQVNKEYACLSPSSAEACSGNYTAPGLNESVQSLGCARTHRVHFGRRFIDHYTCLLRPEGGAELPSPLVHVESELNWWQILVLIGFIFFMAYCVFAGPEKRSKMCDFVMYFFEPFYNLAGFGRRSKGDGDGDLDYPAFAEDLPLAEIRRSI